MTNGGLWESVTDAVHAWSDRGLDAEPIGGLFGWFGVAFAIAYTAIAPQYYPHLIAASPFMFGFSLAEVLPKSRQQLVTALRKAALVYLLITPIIILLLLSWGI